VQTGQPVSEAMKLPLQIDEPADFRSFRIGLFGLDKLQQVDRTVASLASALGQLG
jgi:aspartate aminotransferase-like enzyme